MVANHDIRNLKLPKIMALHFLTNFQCFYWTLLAGNQYIAGKLAKSAMFSNFGYGININFKMNDSFLKILAKKRFF